MSDDEGDYSDSGSEGEGGPQTVQDLDQGQVQHAIGQALGAAQTLTRPPRQAPQLNFGNTSITPYEMGSHLHDTLRRLPLQEYRATETDRQPVDTSETGITHDFEYEDFEFPTAGALANNYRLENMSPYYRPEGERPEDIGLMAPSGRFIPFDPHAPAKDVIDYHAGLSSTLAVFKPNGRLDERATSRLAKCIQKIMLADFDAMGSYHRTFERAVAEGRGTEIFNAYTRTHALSKLLYSDSQEDKHIKQDIANLLVESGIAPGDERLTADQLRGLIQSGVFQRIDDMIHGNINDYNPANENLYQYMHRTRAEFAADPAFLALNPLEQERFMQAETERMRLRHRHLITRDLLPWVRKTEAMRILYGQTTAPPPRPGGGSPAPKRRRQ